MSRYRKPYTLILSDRLIGTYHTQKEAVAKAIAINAAREKHGTGKEYWRVYFEPLRGGTSIVAEGRE